MTKLGVQDHVREWTLAGLLKNASDGNSGAEKYKVWNRWARAAVVVKKVGGHPSGRSSRADGEGGTRLPRA